MISHFSSSLSGGAGIAAQRLHLALCRAGIESKMFFGAGEMAGSKTIPAFTNRSFYYRNAAALAMSWSSRRTVEGGFVTSPCWIRRTPIQGFGPAPEVVNLHWVARWLDLPSFLGSLPTGLPVIWSLHDLIPVTGGCHYPDDCDHFTRHCGDCPQQRKPSAVDATRRYFRIKAKAYSKINLHFIGNSEWTTAQVRRSGLSKYAKSIRTIPLGLDVEQFKPVEKSQARRAIGIPDDRFVVGFACSDISEERKGARLLFEAIKALNVKNILLLTFGSGRWPESSGVDILELGMLNNSRLQSLFYSTLDVFATPSRAETFGNTALESMACETPVIAYATSGLLDVVVAGETGLLEPDVGSVSGLVRMLRWMLDHPGDCRRMGIAGRQRVVQHFTDKLMAERYSIVYAELMNRQIRI